MCYSYTSFIGSAGWREVDKTGLCPDPGVSMEIQAGGHLAEEPRDSKDNPEGLGDI
jgi:hypothetical protein